VSEIPVASEWSEPARPALYTLNIPAPGEVEALLADRERLAAFLAAGHRLWQRSVTRQRESQKGDPLGPQKTRAEAKAALLDSYHWFQVYGPTLLLLVFALATIAPPKEASHEDVG
jgi:hypothetical protein